MSGTLTNRRETPALRGRIQGWGAAVALALPVSDGAGTEADGSADVTPSRELSVDQRTVIADTWRHLGQALQVGLSRMPATLRSSLLADLHRMRVHGLVVAERALTALLTDGGTEAASTLVLNLWQLQRGPVTAELVGVPRQAYRDAGGLVLHPVAAEPVVTASRFAGVQVSFVDREANLWNLSRVLPGDAAQVAVRYQGGAEWAGLPHSPLELSRHTVTISDATASPDGRLGGGRQVRAAVGRPGNPWDVLPPGYRVVSGAIEGGDREMLRVGGEVLEVSDLALRLGAGPGLELLSRAVRAQVRCLVRGSRLVGLQAADETIRPPESLRGVWWPGLDQVERNWVGELAASENPHLQPEPDRWPAIQPSVTVVTHRWLGRTLQGGPVVLEGRSLTDDVAWLRRAGAPFAADLLAQLGEARRAGARRFDGGWEPDEEVFLRAWLSFAAY